MAEEGQNASGNIRRVLVLADSSRTSRAALEAAAELASRHGVELLSLFVEELDLIRLAGLPFARELGTTSGASRPLSRERLERRLKGDAEDLRRRLSALGARHTLSWSLRVVRGRAEVEALAHAAPGDLLVVGKKGWSRLPYSRLGSTPRSLISKASVSIMVYSEPEPAFHSPIVAVFDDPEQGPRTLALAIYIARADSDTLTVLIPEANAGRLMPIARQWLTKHEVEATLKTFPGQGPEDLAAALRDPLQALVVHRDSPMVSGESRQRLLESLDAPVVLVP